MIYRLVKNRRTQGSFLQRLCAITFVMVVSSVTLAQPGDFNGDGALDCQDVDTLSMAIVDGALPAGFDLNADGVLNQEDVIEWLGLAGNANLAAGESYVYGDMNFDGNIDVGDTAFIQSNRFAHTWGYCSGDLNLDGRVDAYDNAIVHANLFTSYESVDGVGSVGVPTSGHLDAYYDPATGKMWLETGGDRYNGWAIPGVEALEQNELGGTVEFGILILSSTYFEGAEQIPNRASPISGIFQLHTYPTGLGAADFGEVIAATVAHPIFTVEAPWETVSPRSTNVTVATVKSWSGGDGSWSSGNWQGGAAPQSGEVAILDFGAGHVRIDANETVTVIESLVRSGNLTIDGVHAGDVTIFDSLESAPSAPLSAMAAVSGGGQIDGNLILMGRLRLEEAITMTVNGEAILSEGYSLLLAGTPVSAVAQLDVADDFQLSAGDSTGEFTVLTADEGIDGVFGDLSVGDEFGAGDLFVESLTYTENDVLISLGRSLPGDANRDGFVDVSDFNIWNQFKFSDETGWGSADFNGDGTTDVADFNVWNENKFTQANTIVPEPAGLSLMLMALVTFAGCRRRV